MSVASPSSLLVSFLPMQMDSIVSKVGTMVRGYENTKFIQKSNFITWINLLSAGSISVTTG